MKRVEYLIIGQGIVGSVMALSLLQRGRSVAVIDEPALSSSSKIAGGVYNPFNFRQMMNNWRAAEMVSSARAHYAFAELISGEKIHTERRILKIFSSADERRLWEKMFDERENLLAEEEVQNNPFGEGVRAPFGIGIVHPAGNVDCGMLIHVVAGKIQSEGSYFPEQFFPGLLSLEDERVVYADKVQADHVIFCEGHLVRENPWFSFMPIKATKGQLLHVSIPGLHTTDVLSRGVSLLPKGKEHFVLSGTFENNRLDEVTDEHGREELLSKLSKFITLPVRVESQFAGIRPGVQDRRPYIGTHPQHRRLSIINGMGSKAALLSPWLSERLIDHIEEGKEIPAEVRVDRFVGR